MSALAPPNRALLGELAELLRVDRFRLFGGAALDLLEDPEAPVADLDVAVDVRRHPPQPTVDRLVAAGLGAGALRPYRINRVEPVVMLDLRWGDRTLDLNFVGSTARIGQFDIESLVWRWPECDVVDRHGARTALRTRRIRLLRGVAGETPMFLFGRLMKLAAKYALGLEHHGPLVAAIADALARERAGATDAHRAAMRTAQAAIVERAAGRAADARAFRAQLAGTGLLEAPVDAAVAG